MILILSPAKNMIDAADVPDWNIRPLSRPAFLQEASFLSKELKQFSPWQLETILGVNPSLALKAFGQYQRFHAENGNVPALLSYQGLQYQHLSSIDFSPLDWDAAQDRLRVISALYGVLRPLDAVLPYRLEMLCRHSFAGKRLYRFWGDRIWKNLSQMHSDEPIINLASQEYAKTVIPYAAGKMITCDFLISKHGRFVCIATIAKMARGQMARMVVKKRLNHPEELQAFQWGGFAFQPRLSSECHYTFIADKRQAL
jgi:hypothetical protein